MARNNTQVMFPFPPQVLEETLLYNLFCVLSNWEHHQQIWEMEKIKFSGKESLSLCTSHSTRNRCNSYSCSNEIIAFRLFALVSIIYYMHTETSYMKIIQVKLKHLELRKCQELTCSWSSISLLLFIHYGRVLNYIMTLFFRRTHASFSTWRQISAVQCFPLSPAFSVYLPTLCTAH